MTGKNQVETKLITQIKEVLSTFPEYWEEETLLRNKVAEDIRAYNQKLIEALLANELIKDTYSITFDSATIFKVEDFISMLRYKNYWENSYTKYANEIGLTSEGKYLKYNTDVVLDFPHKDSLLEGGMSKEDLVKEEIYYHNVLAKEEIDTLLSPKLFSNVKKFNEEGEQEITKFENIDNLIIKGNNLLALHTLKERYAGKVKLIYIDPPYNTGSDSFKYNDKFNRSTWLTFMKNRLEAAYDLLANDGVIFISIDDNQYSYLNILCNEIFGEENLLDTFFVQVRYTNKSLNERDDFQRVMEQVLIYSKDRKSFKPNKPYTEYDTSSFKYKINELQEGEKIKLGGKNVEIFKPGDYEIVESDDLELEGLKATWASGSVLTSNTSGKFFDQHLSKRKVIDGLNVLYKVDGIGEDGLGYRYFTGPKRENAIRGQFYAGIPTYRRKEILEGEARKYSPIVNYYDMSGDFGNIRHEGGVSLNSGKKPEKLLQKIIEISTNKQDLILDFHLGSGTTSATAHKMNRRYIGVEQLDYIEELAIERLKNVIKGDETGVSKDENWQGGGSFVYAELHSLNDAYIKDIQNTENEDKLNNVLKKMKDSAYLNFKVDLNRVTSADEDYQSLTLDEKKNILIQSLDMNQLYLNYSEIDDAQYNISDSVKEFNHSFYQNEGDE